VKGEEVPARDGAPDHFIEQIDCPSVTINLLMIPVRLSADGESELWASVRVIVPL
jgi:hypothetical protein